MTTTNTERKPRQRSTFDLSSLAPTEAELPKVTRGRTATDNPFVEWLGESHATGQGKAVVVPDSEVKTVENAIRRAADILGIGSRVVSEPAGKGKTRVMFAGRDRRAYSPRKRKGSDNE